MKLTLVILNVVAAVALVLLGSIAVAAHRTHAYQQDQPSLMAALPTPQSIA